MQISINQRIRKAILPIVTLATVLISGCASGPSIRADFDKSADFSAYRTFGFVKELGTDRAGYSTLITNHFKQAVTSALETRGYRYAERDPDLLVNFSTNVRHESDVQTVQVPSYSGGYYGYRYGLYSAPDFDTHLLVSSHRVGTVNIDVVDAKRKQLVWEGVLEGALTDEVLSNPEPAIDYVVTELFKRYPARAATRVQSNDQ